MFTQISARQSRALGFSRFGLASLTGLLLMLAALAGVVSLDAVVHAIRDAFGGSVADANVAAATARAEAWRPWRAYAAIYLWQVQA